MTEVVCGVIRSEKGYLIAQKKESLLWEFPGGKIQDGESCNQALIREIKEELNLDIEPVLEIIRYTYGKYILVFVYSICYSDKPIQLKEHNDYVWTEIENLSGYDFVLGDVQFVKYLDDINLDYTFLHG